MKNKKAESMISFFIIASIGLVVIANLFIPQVLNITASQNQVDSLVYVANATNDITFSLSKTDQDTSIPLTISGLTESTNFTYSFATDSVTILANTTASGNYQASYNYFTDGYLTQTSDRSLMRLLILLAIVGMIAYVLRGFGLGE